jgi:DNA-binding Xre family transcriptional regulator
LIVAWEVEVTDEFKAWWDELTEAERISVERVVLLLEDLGPHLSFPYSSGVKGLRHSAMRELRIQHKGCPYRVLYIFDPRRVAILLLGGEKTDDGRWYEKMCRLRISFTMTILPKSRRKTMPKTTKFSELRAMMSPEARAEAQRLADEDLKEMPLHELRAARRLTQQQLAQTLDMTQAAISQLEKRTDIYLSTLGNFVEAMGGRLEMYAVFPDGKVKLGLDRDAS